MKRYQHGFTLIEITAVLVLMAIISAYVIGRSIGTEQIDLAGQTDKIRNQIRYAQSTAMKRSDAIWGITCDTNRYWMFQTNIGTPELLPGEQNTQINLSDLRIDSMAPPFTLFFDRLGKPYTAYTDETTNTPLANNLTLTISAGGQFRTITVIPETGLVQ
jgi:prepilin-type N-terminal cleavage/methylation domain-containing protein